MNRKDVIFGLLAAIALAVLISPFASSHPDGLERVAEDKGFIEKGETAPALASPAPDYAWPGIKSGKLAASAAGAAGTLVVFGFSYALAAVIRKRK
ncbi:MAG: PDGLE domain-containing protein [Candidatus Omnitrophota bacterium]